MEKQPNFLDICNDQSYFEREGNARYYIICFKCGFIPMSMVDRETKFLDLHCKCGSYATCSIFTEEEILAMLDEMV